MPNTLNSTSCHQARRMAYPARCHLLGSQCLVIYKPACRTLKLSHKNVSPLFDELCFIYSNKVRFFANKAIWAREILWQIIPWRPLGVALSGAAILISIDISTIRTLKIFRHVLTYITSLPAFKSWQEAFPVNYLRWRRAII